MLNLSTAFKNELNNDNRNYLCYADITLSNGVTLNLENEEIWDGGLSIEDAVSNTSSFDIGATIINSLSLTVNNIYETFSEYDFTDAIVVPYIGLQLPDGTIEKIRKGLFTVDEPTYNGSLITLYCLDEMHKLDRPYTDSKLVYPATLGEIVRDACSGCDVTLLTTTFNNSSYQIQNRPDDESLTFRQVVSWAAQIACCWARCDSYGRLRLDWYDQSVFEIRDGLDGGVFDESTPYATGDSAKGGTFKPWTTGDNYSGGTFKELTGYHHIHSMSSMNLCTDDVVITGVQVTESFEETDTEKVQSSLYGSAGYVLAIEGNDFVEAGTAATVASMIGKQVVGLRFRTYDISALNDPSIEAGDAVYITDRKNRSYQSFVTSTTFKVGNYQQIRCSAETPSRNSAQRYSEATRSILLARREASKKISDYDKAVQQLTSLITQSFGVYKTEEVLEDGSTVYYMHNKPTLAASQTIWKMTADAFAVSTNGGKTWNAGMDSSGNAVVNVLSTIGLVFDWAKGGTLTLGGQNNTNGLLRALNAAGSQIVSLGKDGLQMASGSINLGNGVFTVDGFGNMIAKSGKFMGDITGASGIFNGILQVVAQAVTGNNPIRIKVPGTDGDGVIYYTYFTAGTDGFVVARNRPTNRKFIRMYVDTGDGIPVFSGGSFSGFNEATWTMTGIDERLKIHGDGEIKSPWTYNNRGSSEANVHINGSQIFQRTGSSSRRYKKYGNTKLDMLDPASLYDLPVRRFKYKKGYLAEDDPRKNQWIIGFFAEEIAEFYPCAAEYENGEIESWNSRIMIPAMLKLIQEQHKDLLKHEKRIRDLEERLAKVEKILGVKL